MNDNNSTRLNKYISESGICSRREADKHIERGVVFINGKKAKIGDRVFPGDNVFVNGHAIEAKTKDDNIYLAFNKPAGIVSTTEANTRDNIVNYVNHTARIFPIGRLDKDSQGLIFLTNNGDIVNKILRAANNHEKEYVVTVNKPITDQFIAAMANGVPMLGVTTKKCVVVKESPFVFRIILIQGLNRQIRRMCEHFNYEVAKLERVRIMNVTLKGLPLGDWRELTRQELEEIFKLVEHSASESDQYGRRKDKGNASANHQNKNQKRPQKKSGAGKSFKRHGSSSFGKNEDRRSKFKSGGRRKKKR